MIGDRFINVESINILLSYVYISYQYVMCISFFISAVKMELNRR